MRLPCSCACMHTCKHTSCVDSSSFFSLRLHEAISVLHAFMAMSVKHGQ